MNLLCTILALVMTFTAETKTSVSAGGDVPAGCVATYSNTDQKNRVKEGESATLLLTGLQGLTIRQIELSMRSNKSSGACEISVTADEQMISRLSGTYQELVGM